MNKHDQTESCECEICREERDLEAVTIAALLLLTEDKTNAVIPLPDNSNATLSQPDAVAGDVMGGKKVDIFYPRPLPLEE